MRAISAYLGITPPSATSIIDELVKKGLIERQADPNDRRIIRLVISQKGDNQLTDSFKEFVKGFDHSMRRLSEKEKELLVKLLLKITE
jgi:DNA-binding MarR family transcriptional regulator